MGEAGTGVHVLPSPWHESSAQTQRPFWRLKNKRGRAKEAEERKEERENKY